MNGSRVTGLSHENPSKNSQIPSVTHLTTCPNWNSLRAPWGTAPSLAPWRSENAEEPQREPGDAGVVCHIIHCCQRGLGARRDIGWAIGYHQPSLHASRPDRRNPHRPPTSPPPAPPAPPSKHTSPSSSPPL